MLEIARATPVFQEFLRFSQVPFWRISPVAEPEGARRVEVMDLRFGAAAAIPGFQAGAVVSSGDRCWRPNFQFGRCGPVACARLRRFSSTTRRICGFRQAAATAHNRNVLVTDTESILDREQLRDVTLDDPDLMKEILEALVEDTSLQLGRLEQAVREADTSQCARLAHYCKGACANVGARRAAAAMLHVERRALAGRYRRMCGSRWPDCRANWNCCAAKRPAPSVRNRDGFAGFDGFARGFQNLDHDDVIGEAVKP